MARHAFRLGAWLALLLSAATAVAAVGVGVAAGLSLAGKVSYPVDVSVGPVDLTAGLGVPVGLTGQVCQEASISSQASRDCFLTFIHPGDGSLDALGWGSRDLRRQDADIRPTQVALSGVVAVESTAGWNPFVAATAARGMLGLLVLSATFALLWRILARTAAGQMFGTRSIRDLRVLGWIVVIAALTEPAIDHLSSVTQLGYAVEAFGSGPMLLPTSEGTYPDGIDLWQLGLGLLALLLAEVFRHGATLETEQRLTV